MMVQNQDRCVHVHPDYIVCTLHQIAAPFAFITDTTVPLPAPFTSQRASEGNANGDSFPGSSGVNASSILAALPPGLGQAASALTSFASSFKRENGTGADRENENGEQREGAEGGAAEAAEPGDAGEAGEEGQHQQDDKKPVEEESHYTQAEGDQSAAHEDGQEDQSTDDYRNEHATQAAIAAMESLAAQSNLHMQDSSMSKNGGRAKRDTGPEAERMRKDQHKEVERKRREQISNGITELAAIVPGCDTKGINKTAIINAAVRYIMELKNNEASNIEKWTLEKLLMDQAMGDLSTQLDVARKEISRLRAQLGLPDEPEEEQQAYTEEAGATQGEEGAEQLTAAPEEHPAIQDDGVEQQPDVAEQEPVEPVDVNADDGGAKEGAAANALSQVAEAAIAAAAAETQQQQHSEADGNEQQPTQTEADEVDGKAKVRRRGASDVDAPKADAARVKRSRNA